MKPVLYEAQFVAKMRRRGITRQQVRFVIARGTDLPHITFLGEYRRKKGAGIGRRTLVVVYLENAERILPISTYWLGEHDDAQKNDSEL